MTVTDNQLIIKVIINGKILYMSDAVLSSYHLRTTLQVDPVTLPILQMRKLRHREVK